MDLFIEIFGKGEELGYMQISARAFAFFFFTLVLIRISGRRSFGMHAPFDNIIIVLLGSILSRAVVGASPFWPTTLCCLVITVLHRIVGRLSVKYSFIEKIIKGEKILLYQDNKIIEKKLFRSLVSQADIEEEIRLTFKQESYDKIKKIYMERCGRISIIEK